MERNRKGKDGGVLGAVAELFDLPADVVAGLPRLEMIGRGGSCIWSGIWEFWRTAISKSM